MKRKFEDFLKDKHMECEPEVLDDDLSDAFDYWVANLDIETLIIYIELNE